MPTARVLPDWSLRFSYGHADPLFSYGGAVGLWDRLEFHGQYTRVGTFPGFSGSTGYGDYKDRSAGARLVLIRENNFRPQVAAGFYDATGTALLGSRYLVTSKKFGNLDLTLGLGQGILAGEYVPDTITVDANEDRAFSFLLSDPLRKTKPFGGLEWRLTPNLIFAAEYSSINRPNLLGYRDKGGNEVKEDKSTLPFNLGLKYHWGEHLNLSAAAIRGSDWALAMNATFPLEPEGMLPWKKQSIRKPGERARWLAFNNSPDGLARQLAKRIKDEGFQEVAVALAENAVWLEAANSVHLSSSRALAHLAVAVEPILPPDINTLYISLKKRGMVTETLTVGRTDLQAYLQSRLDTAGLLAFADFSMPEEQWHHFENLADATELYTEADDRFTYTIAPRVRSYINDRSDFFKHKAVAELRGDFRLWKGAHLSGQYEYTLFNQYDELKVPDWGTDVVRTDSTLYERELGQRVAMLAFDQVGELPWRIQGRFSTGIFESAYAGFGTELFRYFHDGLWGVGLESETVRKRDVSDNFALRDDIDQWFTTGFLNVYAQLWPSQGLDGGIKVGRFLAGDSGIRLEVRRTFKHFTLGAFFTKTDTSKFQGEQNRTYDGLKGVYIRIPFSIFQKKDTPGQFGYTMTGFVRDPGQTVRQPSQLYPISPEGTPVHTRRHLEEMRNW